MVFQQKGQIDLFAFICTANIVSPGVKGVINKQGDHDDALEITSF